ncbi:unnamed protein product [Adineta steineri]|uniref:Uncharacterized protein n=1 Tax=Adineta steineri TaxID=433720 RepID=A0A818KMN6_9BILA|nr:unnamed protein product [Adineta steineri]CAF1236123.1 unnamed protein product [Adineta steineri]CAF3558991.1 unnamed protein product [Adineta steineri]CAF4131202.1 unnamed protein product [Adineta steineri]
MCLDTIIEGTGRDIRLNQLYHPHGIYVDNDDSDQIIYIADYHNHRIVKWNRNTNEKQVVAGGNEKGNGMDQLSHPTDIIVDKEHDSLIICDCGNKRVVQWPRVNGKNGQIIISEVCCIGLTMDNNGNLYVSDSSKHEVKRWKIGDTHGTIVAGGNGQGHDLNQLSFPSFIFVDQDHSVYVSDCSNHRVMKWMKDAKEGIVVAGGQGQGNSLRQLSNPEGIVVDHVGDVYVADSKNDRIMYWSKGCEQGSIIVGSSENEARSDQLRRPKGLSFDREGDLYVADSANHRIEKFYPKRN